MCLIFFLQKLFFVDEDRKHEDKWGENRFFCVTYYHWNETHKTYEMPKTRFDFNKYSGLTCINLCVPVLLFTGWLRFWRLHVRDSQWADSNLRCPDRLARCSHAATACSNSAQTFWTSKETFLLVSNTYEGHHRDVLAQAFWFDMLLLNQTKLDDLFHQGFLVIKYIIRTPGIGLGVGLDVVRHV